MLSIEWWVLILFSVYWLLLLMMILVLAMIYRQSIDRIGKTKIFEMIHDHSAV